MFLCIETIDEKEYSYCQQWNLVALESWGRPGYALRRLLIQP